MIAASLPTVPLVEIRLAVPLLVGSDVERARLLALAAVLDGADAPALTALRASGGDLRVTAGTDQLMILGFAPADRLGPALRAVRELLEPGAAGAPAAAPVLAGLAARLAAAAAHPALRARAHLLRACFGGHPAAREFPSQADLTAVTEADLAATRAAVLQPDRATLVLVGAVDPDRAATAADAELAGWCRTGPVNPIATDPPRCPPAVHLVQDARPGSAHLRLAATLDHDTAAAAELAGLLLARDWGDRLAGGPASGYDPAVTIQYVAGAGLHVLTVDGTADRAATLLRETRRSLRAAARRPAPTDLATARATASGRLVLALSSQSGCATALAALAVRRAPPDWLRTHLRRLAETSAAEVAAAGEAFGPVAGVLVVPPGALVDELAARPADA